MTHGKNYLNASKKIDADKQYSLEEAVKLATETASTKFDSTVELHLNMGIDPKQSDQQIRNIVVLPHGTGKKVSVAAFVAEDDAKKAIAAGADFAGADDLIEKVTKKQWTDFDVAVATPDIMKKLAKAARILGPKKLMPNPKAGTVAKDFEKAIKEVKKGRIEFRNDPSGIVHSIVGKVSFGTEKLIENTRTLIDSVKSLKPSSIKGTYIITVSISTSMGPGINIDVSNL